MSKPVIQEITEQDIEKAFDHKLFSMEYQPQAFLNTPSKIAGAEAFVRLNHPTLGLMMPASFLPLIKSMNLMLKLTRYVLERVAEDWSEWKRQGTDIQVSVNIDDSILYEGNLARELGQVLSESAIPKGRITLEFANCWAQGTLMPDIGKKLLGLRMKGYRIAIDDYGRERIEDSVFADLPVDEIKLDRQIISELGLEQNKEIAKKAMHIANRYGLRLVAVGLEDNDALEWLARMGCDAGQGYFISKPLGQDAFFTQIIKSGQLTVIDETKTSILIIEDDPEYQKLLVQSLNELYTLRVAGTLAEAKEILQVFSPDVVLLDVYLPDGTGIEFCKAHIDTESQESVSVIFISGAQDFENKLQAYEAGGSDYIQKPFSIIELMAKIKQITQYQSRRQELISHAEAANQMAMQSLKETAYYGEIVQFLKNLLCCYDEEQMARELFRFMSQKSLSTCVEFRDGRSFIHFDQVSGACSPIEMNVFDLLRNKSRLYAFSQRLIVNDKHVSFLVKNMPDNDEEQGKIRDYVAVLIEGMEARYQEVMRQRVLNTVTQQLEKLAHKLISIVDDDKKNNNDILEKYSFELQMSFHTLDLTDEQETHISRIIGEMLKTKEIEEQNASVLTEEVMTILDTMKGALREMDDQKASQNQAADNNTVDLF